MKNKIFAVIVTIIAVVGIIFCFTGCTEQTIAREWGGTYEIELPKGEKLIEVTWKDANLFYLTRPMHDDEYPETYKFQEDSEWGVWEGTVIIKESR